MMDGKQVWVVAGMLALGVGGAQGQAVLDDLEGGNSINKFGGQWNFSGDFWDKGDSKILSAVDTSVVVPFFKGAYGGGYPDGGGNAAKLEFRFGTTKPGTPPNTYENNVSMNCPLGPDDAKLDLTGAQSVTFYAKADKALQVEMVLNTANITDYAFYTSVLNVGAAWAKYTVKLATGAGGLTRRNFGVTKPLDLSQALGLGWEVNHGKNAAVSQATLWIDDISFQGYTFKAPEPRGSCIANGCITAPGSAPKPAVLVADFEGADATLSALGTRWSLGSAAPMGSDAKASHFTSGVDSTDFTLAPQGHGYGGSNGGMLGFELGDVWFTPEGYLQLPSVNLSTYLSNDSNLDVGAATGLYFDYMTSGEVDYVDVKIRTNQVHAENIYAIAYTRLKATGGQWKGALLKWSDFVLPNWGAAFQEAEKAMRFTNIVSLEWSVTSAKKNIQGSIAVDNVYLTGIPELPQPIPSRLAAANASPGQGRLLVGRGSLRIPFRAPAGSHVGQIRILDASGHELDRQPFVAEGVAGTSLEMRLDGRIPHGLMLVRVESRYGAGLSFATAYPAVNLE